MAGIRPGTTANYPIISNRLRLAKLLGEEAEQARSDNDPARSLSLYARICLLSPMCLQFCQKKAELELLLGDKDGGRKCLISMAELSRNGDMKADLLRAVQQLRPGID